MEVREKTVLYSLEAIEGTATVQTWRRRVAVDTVEPLRQPCIAIWSIVERQCRGHLAGHSPLLIQRYHARSIVKWLLVRVALALRCAIVLETKVGLCCLLLVSKVVLMYTVRTMSMRTSCGPEVRGVGHQTGGNGDE